MGKKKDGIISNYTQIFFDKGKGFSEGDSIRLPVHFGEHEYIFKLESPSVLNLIRMDPLDNYAIIDLINIKGLNTNSGEEFTLDLLEHNGISQDISENDPPRFRFDHDDPQMFFKTPEKEIDKIVLNMIVDEYSASTDTLSGQKKAIEKEQADKLNQPKINLETKLLKHINGKINLQSAEIEYLKTMIQSGFISLRSNTKDEESEYLQHLKTELDAEKEKKEKVKTRLQDIEDVIANKNIYVNKLESDFNRIKSELKSSIGKNEKLEKDNKIHHATIESQKVNLKVLTDELKILKRTIKSLEKKNLKDNVKIGSLNTTIKSLRLELRKERRQSLKFKSDFDSLQGDFSKQTEEIKALSAKSSELDQFNTELNTLIEFLD